jgi:hypothetical protein
MNQLSLSEELTELLEEAKKLLNLKSEFSRLPNGPVKDTALALIEYWFNKYPSTLGRLIPTVEQLPGGATVKYCVPPPPPLGKPTGGNPA